jgi:hypothetical protein
MGEQRYKCACFNPLHAELNPICHLLALLGAHHIFHVSRIRVKLSSGVSRDADKALFFVARSSPRNLRGFLDISIFTGLVCRSHAHSPTWRTRLSRFVWLFTLDLSGMGGSASRYATTGITLRILWPRKPLQFVKVGVSSGGGGCVNWNRK